MDWPRIKDLPEHEQEPFKEWLRGQTCPMQDAYYEEDYKRWKQGLPVID